MDDHQFSSTSSQRSTTPTLPSSTSTAAYFLRCGHCVQTVENKKYKCHECGAYLCPRHRRKLKTFLSSTYYCLPNCHGESTNDASSSAVPSSHDRRPPSATALKGKVTVLQTSFGLIQEVEHTPPRGEEESHHHYVGENRSGNDRRSSGSVAAIRRSVSAYEYHHSGGSGSGGDEYSSSYWFGSGGDAPASHHHSEKRSASSSSHIIPPTTRAVGYDEGARKQVAAQPTAELVYNHRGELQQLAPSTTARISSASTTSSSHTTTQQPPSMQHSRSRRSLIEGGGGVPDDEDTAPARPVASLPTVPSTSSLNNQRPRVRGFGLPFVVPEPVNQASGKRHVMIGPEMQILVTPEEKVRFVEIELNTTNGVNFVRGTVLGHEDSSPHLMVWHERGKRYPQRLLPADVKSIHAVHPARCKHCGAILARDEADEHVASHRLGGGVDVGTAVGDERLGTACGDTALLLRVVRLKQLGAGAQGEVWLCRDGAQTVVDALPMSDSFNSQSPANSPTRRLVQKRMTCADDKEATAKYQQSVRLMSLSHVHLIRYLAVQKAPREPVVTVLMPYYHEGDLAGLIRAQREPFKEHYVSSLLLQLSAGLHFLHNHTPTIIHGDIKPENVLLFNRREQIVLMDLDASRELSTYHRAATGVHIGTTAWMAPETLHQEESTTRSDIWSLGLLAYVLLVLPDFPMLHCDATSENELLNSTSWAMEELLRRVGGRIVSRGFSKGIALLVTRMLHHDPRRRPHAAEIGEKVTELMTSQLVTGSSD